MAPERWAGQTDGRIAAAERRADRPVSVVVGEDAPTIEAAVAAAPANTTVVVPPGTYEETLTVNESVTIAGEDAQISGDGDGSVITVRAPDVALTGLAVDGSGGQTRDPEAARGSRRRRWGQRFGRRRGVGHQHPTRLRSRRCRDPRDRRTGTRRRRRDGRGERERAAPREGSHAVVRDLRVDGADSWQDGFMGIAGMGSRVTVTDSAFEGGRDGIYLHRADGSVVRNSTFTDNRYGTHLMYTGDALIADNAFRNELFGGITVMTPSGNAIVGNDVRNSSAGCRRLVPGRTSGTTRSSATNSASRPARAGRCTSATWPRTTSWAHERPRSSRRAGSSRTTSSATRTTRPPGRARSGSGPTATAGTTGRGKRRGPRARRASVPPDRPGRRCPPPRGRRGRRARVARGRPPRPTPGTVPGARSGSIIDPAPAAEPYSPDRIDAALDPDAGPVRADWRAELGDGSGESDEDAAMNAHDRNATSGVSGRDRSDLTGRRCRLSRSDRLDSGCQRCLTRPSPPCRMSPGRTAACRYSTRCRLRSNRVSPP